MCAALVTWHCIGAGAFKCTGAGEEHFVIPMKDTGESHSMKSRPRILYLPVVKSGPVPERNPEPEARQERIGFIDPKPIVTSQKQAWGQKCLEFPIPLIKIICFML